MTTAETIATMTPEQLLAPESYAVCRFIDGAFAWVVDLFTDEDDACQCAEKMVATTSSNYRVVRIAQDDREGSSHSLSTDDA